MKSCRIVIFAKAPQVGHVKTRLIPALGAEGAACLARLFLQRTCEGVLRVTSVTAELCGSPAPDHPAWQDCILPDRLLRTDQGEGDLGDRLSRAAERVTGEGQAVLLIGTDCPSLSDSLLTACCESLTTHDCVMIPALDGGYVLLGMRAFAPSLFRDIPWSTATVADETRARIRELAWSLKEWPPLPDIDEPQDLVWLSTDGKDFGEEKKR